MRNLFTIPEEYGLPGSPERFETILTGTQGLLVERIVSHGHITPQGEWYDQERDEWVVVIEGDAVLGYEDGSELALVQGDHVFIPKHVRHRVVHTSSPCIWLALHGNLCLPPVYAADNEHSEEQAPCSIC